MKEGKKMSTYRVLALDGGGTKGLLTATVLDRLNQAHPGFLKSIDLIAGTSTGGLLALAIAGGIPPKRIAALYRTRSKKIFKDSLLDNLKDMGNARGAQYESKPLQREIERVLGERRLRDLATRVLIPAFDLNSGTKRTPKSWKPKFFHNFPGDDSDGAELATNVAMRTTAAPTYFPSYQGYIDGGVVANNPSMAALATALDERCGNQALGDVAILSLSSGTEPKYIKGETLDWGWARWARPVINLMISGTMGVAHFQCEKILGRRYHRVDPTLSRGVDMDAKDEKTLQYLQRRGQTASIGRTLRWLEAVDW